MGLSVQSGGDLIGGFARKAGCRHAVGERLAGVSVPSDRVSRHPHRPDAEPGHGVGLPRAQTGDREAVSTSTRVPLCR